MSNTFAVLATKDPYSITASGAAWRFFVRNHGPGTVIVEPYNSHPLKAGEGKFFGVDVDAKIKVANDGEPPSTVEITYLSVLK